MIDLNLNFQLRLTLQLTKNEALLDIFISQKLLALTKIGNFVKTRFSLNIEYNEKANT